MVAQEKSSLKRSRVSNGEQTDLKKPRRSQRISSQLQQGSSALEDKAAQVSPQQKQQKTPLKDKTRAYPSPLTHAESTNTDQSPYRQTTASPPEGRPSQLNHRSPIVPPASQGLPISSQRQPVPALHGGLSSPPPSDTQLFSQVPIVSKTFADNVYDEETEGIWGYLVPLDPRLGDTLVLMTRTACPAPYPGKNFGRGTKKRAKGQAGTKSYKQEEIDYEAEKHLLGFASGGYLIGRHPECDRRLDLPTISNRHCLLFNENKNGKNLALIEDLSSNGTFVNEAIIGRNKRRELENADEISILDQARFMFYYPANRDGNAFRQQFRILQQIGKGHFATVYLCVERNTGVQYAVKKFERKHGASGKNQTDGLQQEIGVLKSISHPNVLCLQDTFNEEDGVYIVLELAPEGELFNCIVMKQKLTEEETRKIFIQLFQGIRYLHERNIVHRDIKPENILLSDKELSVKIADFGLAKIIGEESFTTTLCGTPSYVAPEILKNSRHRKYTRAVDVWSLGVVLYICLCGFPPFSDELYTEENPYTLSQQIKMGRFDYPSPYWDSVGDPALDLIDRMLTVDVDKRITIDDCLEHPWITLKDAKTGASTTNGSARSVKDSTDGLAGAFQTLDFSKRKPQRERTLLADLNDVKVSQVVKMQADSNAIHTDDYHRLHNAGVNKADQPPVKIFNKNVSGKILGTKPGTLDDDNVPSSQPFMDAVAPQDIDSQMSAAPIDYDDHDGLDNARGHARAGAKTAEDTPSASQRPAVFMEMGGKGDMQLFEHDQSSRYDKSEVPPPKHP